MTAKRSDGVRATWALAAAQLVSWGSIYYAFPLFVVPMESALAWSRTATNAALSIGLLISGLAAYPIGTWINRGHGRRVMVCGSTLAAAMLALWSQANSLAILFVVWAGLGVAMAATLYDPVFAVVTRDFPDSFRTRITLITLVAGFASTVFIPLTQGLIKWCDWRGALLVLAAFNLAICLPLHIFAIGWDAPRDGESNYKATQKAANAAATRRALRTPTFCALAVCFTAYYATFAALTFHLVPLMAQRRVSPALILTTMAVIGPAQVLARVLWFTIGPQRAAVNRGDCDYGSLPGFGNRSHVRRDVAGVAYPVCDRLRWRQRHDDDLARDDRAGRDVDRGLWSRERTTLDALEYCQGHCADFGRCNLDDRRKLPPCRMDRVAGVIGFSRCVHPGDASRLRGKPRRPPSQSRVSMLPCRYE